jgi:hypothetical protein
VCLWSQLPAVTTCISSEDGINWTTRAVTRASGTGISLAIHGNPNQTGIWAFISGLHNTAASSAVLGATAKARVFVSENKIFAIRVTDPGSAYAAAPTITITDPNNLFEAPTQVRIGNGACANVSFIDRGTGFDSAIVEQDTGDGYANNFQSGKFMGVRRLTGIPRPGANVVFATQPTTVYKLVQVLSESESLMVQDQHSSSYHQKWQCLILLQTVLILLLEFDTVRFD